MDGTEFQEAALKQAIANARPRAIKRHLLRSMTKLDAKQKHYEKILKKKSFDKTSSMFMSGRDCTRPKTTSDMSKSRTWHDENSDTELYIYKEYPQSKSNSAGESDENLSISKISLNSLRPVIRPSKAFATPQPIHEKPTRPSTTPVTLPPSSPIAKSMSPYYKKTKGNNEMKKINVEKDRQNRKSWKKQIRHNFLFHDPGLSPARNMARESVPFMQHPKFYTVRSRQFKKNADGIKEVRHRTEFYCRE